MAQAKEGGCMCGAVRYRVEGDPLAVVNCYCTDCQHVSGGAFVTALLLPRLAVTVTKGKATGFSKPSDSGDTVTRSFCRDCGAPLFSELSANPNLMVVKLGSLDDPKPFSPSMSIWTGSALRWAQIDPNLPQFPKNPPLG